MKNNTECFDKEVDITIYRDTVDIGYKGDDNLIIVRVFEECIRRYVKEGCL